MFRSIISLAVVNIDFVIICVYLYNYILTL